MSKKQKKKQPDYTEKFLFAVSYFLRLIILIEAVTAAWNKNLEILFIAVGILILTFIPSLIARNYKINIPTEFEALVVLFISSSLFLGEVHQFYTKFWWWDLFLHSLSGILLGFAGFLALYIMYTERKIRTSPKLAMFFSFCVAVAIGALWEIVEFSVDNSLGWNMQKSGLVDTMWDLIVDSISAVIISISGYFYLRRKNQVPFFERWIKKFMEKNPRLFSKRKR
ncbi:MAG: hypothetical protein AABX82_09720 [Nanoarchaeota archaeon]